METISFGTDGWRAIIAEDFTFENLGIIAQAMSEYLLNNYDSPSIGIGYDTRFMSERFARHLGKILKANHINVMLSDNYLPTPVLSYTIKNRGLNAGIMITASHNPYYYSGVKFKAGYGGSAMVELTNKIESYLQKSPLPYYKNQNLETYDFFKDYHDHIKKYVDLDLINSIEQTIVFDSMHGAGTGYLEKFFNQSQIDIQAINANLNPNFDFTLPEPIPDNLQQLSKQVKYTDAVLGFATDGDADRFGIVDQNGNFIQLHDLLPILFEYLINSRNWDGDVVRTTSMSSTIDKLAAEYNRQVIEVPVGFKNICEKMLDQDILIGGEESGGFGYKNHIPERDGILSILLVLEMLAAENTNLHDKIARLRNKYGPFSYDRIDQYCDIEKTKANMENLINNPPSEIGGYKIERINTIDGIKFYFDNDAWMLIRLSQTEPLFRIYVGGKETETVQNILQAGQKLLTN